MGFQYDLTAQAILQLLGYTEPVGQKALAAGEQAHDVQLPAVLFDFWRLAADAPLFKTADIWTAQTDFFRFFYDEIEEWIAEEKDFWAESPEDAEEDDYYQFYQLPKAQWGTLAADYLLIGSDYGAGIAKFGLRLDELAQNDPPVYLLIAEDSLTDWQMLDTHLSDFLRRSLGDVLSCIEYQTGAAVLREKGWTAEAVQPEDIAGLELDQLLRQKSLYGADAVCGVAYDAARGLLIAALRDRDGGKGRVMAYGKI